MHQRPLCCRSPLYSLHTIVLYLHSQKLHKSKLEPLKLNIVTPAGILTLRHGLHCRITIASTHITAPQLVTIEVDHSIVIDVGAGSDAIEMRNGSDVI